MSYRGLGQTWSGQMPIAPGIAADSKCHGTAPGVPLPDDCYTCPPGTALVRGPGGVQPLCVPTRVGGTMPPEAIDRLRRLAPGTGPGMTPLPMGPMPGQAPVVAPIGFFEIGSAIFSDDPVAALDRLRPRAGVIGVLEGLVSYAKITAVGTFIGIPVAYMFGRYMGRRLSPNRRRRRR